MVLNINCILFGQSPCDQLVLKGIDIFNNGDFFNAFTFYTQAIDDHCIVHVINYEDIFYYRAQASWQLGQLNVALVDMETAINLNPKNISYYGFRALRLYFPQKEFDSVLSDYAKIISLEPKNPFGYFKRANFYIYIGDFDKALADISTLIRLCPKDASYLYNRAKLHTYLGLYQNALEDYKSAIKIAPKESMYYYSRSEVFEKLGNSGSENTVVR
jgi:tetratricopeptide (TPR) repeat protein